MALEKLKTGFFNTGSYDEPDRRYSSFDFVKQNSFSHNGYVFGIKEEFSIENTTGLVVEIKTGLYNIEGHFVENDSIKNFTLQPTSSGNERWDIIVCGIIRDANKIIDGNTLSREGYIRVISGTANTIGNAVIPFDQIVNEELKDDEGTKEEELYLIKVTGGGISEINDKRVSTSTEEIKTFISKEISGDNSGNNEINLNEYNLNTSTTFSDTNGTITTGDAKDILNKEIELRISNTDTIKELNYLDIKINDVEFTLEFKSFYPDWYVGNRLYNIYFFIEGGKLKVTQNLSTSLGLLDKEFFIHIKDSKLEIWSTNRKTDVKEKYLESDNDFFKDYDNVLIKDGELFNNSYVSLFWKTTFSGNNGTTIYSEIKLKEMLETGIFNKIKNTFKHNINSNEIFASSYFNLESYKENIYIVLTKLERRKFPDEDRYNTSGLLREYKLNGSFSDISSTESIITENILRKTKEIEPINYFKKTLSNNSTSVIVCSKWKTYQDDFDKVWQSYVWLYLILNNKIISLSYGGDGRKTDDGITYFVPVPEITNNRIIKLGAKGAKDLGGVNGGRSYDFFNSDYHIFQWDDEFKEIGTLKQSEIEKVYMGNIDSKDIHNNYTSFFKSPCVVNLKPRR